MPSFWGFKLGKPETTMLAPSYVQTLDDDVQREIQDVDTGNHADKPLVVKALAKDYGLFKKKTAVEGVSFTMQKGSLFALLGHNGAGKSTTIGMLIGMHPPSRGDAEVCGASIAAGELSTVRTKLGVCPQHDILWDDLTPAQHLELFAQFKGMPIEAREIEIDRLLHQVNLSEWKHKPTKMFSGGMKRRLSVSIANIGNPEVICLDEPTTGMDPHSRRQVWQLIQELKEHACVLLTTHSMEEADALSDRLAVMVKGQMRCLGSSMHLKNKFGVGYQLKLVSSPDRAEELAQFMQQHLPTAALDGCNAGSYIYNISSAHISDVPNFIEQVQIARKGGDQLVSDWGISQTTLEEVYLAINRQFHVYEGSNQASPYEDEALMRPPGAAAPGTQPDASMPLKAGDPSSPLLESQPNTQPTMPAPVQSPPPDTAVELPMGKCYEDEPGVERQSYPMRALIRKNVKFQRRQPCALCCLIASPVLVIVLLVILKIAVIALTKQLNDNSTNIKTYDVTDLNQIGRFQSGYYNMDGAPPQPWFYLYGDLDALGNFGTDTATGERGEDPNNLGTATVLGKVNRVIYWDTTTRQEWDRPNHDPMYFPYYGAPDGGDSWVDDRLRSLVNKGQALYVENVKALEDWSEDKVSQDFFDLLGLIPWAAIKVNHVDVTERVLSYGVQVQNYTLQDNNVPIGFWEKDDRHAMQAGFMHAMHNAFTQQTGGTAFSASVRPMSFESEPFDMALIIDYALLFLLPLLFLVPIPFFLYHIVFEKEHRLRELMKMNGMTMKHYWQVEFISSFGQYMAIVIVLLIALVCIQARWVMQTNFLFIFLLVVGMGLNAVSVATFFAALLDSATAAMILGVIGTIIIWILGSVVNSIEMQTNGNMSLQPPYYMFFPPLAFIHGVFMSLNSCMNYRCPDLEALRTEAPLWGSLVYLWIEAPIYYLLGLYLDKVVKSKWGVREHWLFPLQYLRKPTKAEAKALVEDLDGITEDDVDADTVEDRDVQQMRADVRNGKYDEPMPPVLIKKLHKKYNTEGFTHVAVNCLDLAIQQDVCFGLLGPNGAGKTTTISMLCGLIPPTSGRAWVSQTDITEDIHRVHLYIGICPQHDILWKGHLDVEDHCLLISRLKGVPAHAEQDHVTYWLSRVNLLQYRKTLPRNMSGGEQRRLSIAMALIGNPRIVFFDEPTTGLDPSIRRIIWDLIMDNKNGRSMILTTHSMEEAEILSDEIGIFAKGKLRCLGSPLHLKGLYGKGFRVTVAFPEEARQDVLQMLNKVCPAGQEAGLHISGVIAWEFSGERVNVTKVFRDIQDAKQHFGITDWSLSQATLEDVFLNIIKMTETASFAGGSRLSASVGSRKTAGTFVSQ